MIGKSGLLGSSKPNKEQIDNVQETAKAVDSIFKHAETPATGASNDYAVWRIYSLYEVMQERVKILTWLVISVLVLLVVQGARFKVK